MHHLWQLCALLLLLASCGSGAHRDVATDSALGTDADAVSATLDANSEIDAGDGEPGGADAFDAISDGSTPDSDVFEAVLLPQADTFDPTFAGYPDATVTTLLQTLRPRYGFRKYVETDGAPLLPQKEFGRLYRQPGEPHLTRNDLNLERTQATRRSVLYFFQFGDGQVNDNESPATIAKNNVQLGGLSASAYREHFPFIAHLTDSVIQAATRFSLSRPFDFAIQLGDLGSNGQRNELEWAMALMGGGVVDPDSGSDDDPLSGPLNDARDPFFAQGLGSVKWVAALGNHDALVNGNFPAGLVLEANTPQYENAVALIATLGLALPGVGTSDQHRAFLPAEQDPALLLDPLNFNLDLLLSDEELKALGNATIPTDSKRAFLNRCQLVEILLGAPGVPPGHGLTQSNATHCTAWFAVDPIPGVPIRLLVLDTSSPIGGAEGILSPPLKGDGTVDEALRGNPEADQLAWLKLQLETATTEGIAVIVASHHVSSALTTESILASVPENMLNLLPDFKSLLQKWLPPPQEALSSAAFRQLLSSYPNVVLHVAGHWHGNYIRTVCPDGTLVSSQASQSGTRCKTDAGANLPEKGYYEIVGPAPESFPHQGRIMEIVDNGDGTGSVFTTVIDAQGQDGSLFERGRLLSLARIQATNGGNGGLNHPLDRNTELIFRWPTAVSDKLKGQTLPTKIESETTLIEPAPVLPRLPLPLP